MKYQILRVSYIDMQNIFIFIIVSDPHVLGKNGKMPKIDSFHGKDRSTRCFCKDNYRFTLNTNESLRTMQSSWDRVTKTLDVVKLGLRDREKSSDPSLGELRNLSQRVSLFPFNAAAGKQMPQPFPVAKRHSL
jgi:hypothetical protein